MITQEQIQFIAELPEYADFRFEQSFGRTIIVVKIDNRETRVYENGNQFWQDGQGPCYFVGREGI